MNEREFLLAMEEIVSAPSNTLKLDDAIQDITGFDSMSYIGIILYAESHGVTVGLEELVEVKNLTEMFKLISHE